jgi:uncharacterized hydrophobic protein (TIGR00271 family)
MGWMTRAIDAGKDHRNSLEDVADGLFVDIGDTRAKVSQFWVLLVLSASIAAGGVIGDATPAVIGAMIVAPLATPIYGVALATVMGSSKHLRAALVLLVSGIVVNIAIGALFGLLTSQAVPIDANPQIVGRTAPRLLDLMIAVATGVAGSFALTRRDVSNILAGVAIAISLVPVLAVVGITVGAGRFDLAWGALLLFLTNVAAILIAGTITFGAAGYAREAVRRDPRVAHRARAFIVVLVLALLVPLGFASLRTRRYEMWLQHSTDAADSWVEGSDWKIDSVHVAGDTIVIKVFGPDEPPIVADLKAAVRRDVPSDVPVEVVEESGTTTQL